MRRPVLRIPVSLGLPLLLATIFFPAPSRAQSVWDKIKQKAKQAEQQAGGQQGQQQGQPAGTASTPSQPAAAGQPAGSAPAAGGAGGGDAAAPWSPDSGSTVGAAATAGSASTFASSAPPDFSKLPDISGLKLGMTPAEVVAALKASHQNSLDPRLQPSSGNDKTPSTYLSAHYRTGPSPYDEDSILVYYSMPPTNQEAYAIGRHNTYPRPGIDRVKLVAALRQKYGPETKAGDRDQILTTDDSKISTMWWVFDEQGHVVPPSKGAIRSGPPFGCNNNSGWWEPQAFGNAWINMVNGFKANSLPPAGTCDAVVMLSVILSWDTDPAVSTQFVLQAYSSLDEHPLLRRDAKIASDAAMADAQKKQQQQLDQSKKAVPTL